MRASFKLERDMLVITLDDFNLGNQQKNMNLELALLHAFRYDRSMYWAWRGNEEEGMNRCVITKQGSTPDDMATAQDVLADFCE